MSDVVTTNSKSSNESFSDNTSASDAEYVPIQEKETEIDTKKKTITLKEKVC